MLSYLRARNLGILEDVSIEPGSGLTVITGETGAGKTLLLGALRLLAGAKARQSAIGPFGTETVSEGLFGEGDGELGVTRVVPRQGRSRAYIDGNLVAATVLEEKLGGLIEIVGQHDQLLLRKSQSVLRLVDGILDGHAARVRTGYEEAWAIHRSALADQRRLGGDRMALERELDLVRYQANEIAAAGLERGDDLHLESMAARLRNAEAIRESLTTAETELESAGESIGIALSRLRKVADIDSGLSALVADTETVDILAHELLGAVRDVAQTATEDPDALELLEQRITSLGDLKRKYGHTLEAVLDFAEAAAMRAVELEQLLEKAADIDTLVSRSESDLTDAGAALTAARRSAIRRIEEEAQGHLGALGLPSASLRFAIEPTEPGPSGADHVELVFASDERLAEGSIQEVASGGELSRLVLALRLATRSKEADTLVFDEIDAGVGGMTALALGRKLADLSKTCQVLCVTHLPQVAAHAETHYLIERTGPTAVVRHVEGEARLSELSRMLAGLPKSERGREAAAELLEGARA